MYGATYCDGATDRAPDRGGAALDVVKRERRSRRLSRVVMVCVAAWTAVSIATPDTAAAQAAVTAPNSADRLIIWANCAHVVDMTDASLDLWKSRGVDGIICMHGRMRMMGGKQDFTGDPHQHRRPHACTGNEGLPRREAGEH
jgi:hypothetical protein